jgi:hypothetical protein
MAEKLFLGQCPRHDEPKTGHSVREGPFGLVIAQHLHGGRSVCQTVLKGRALAVGIKDDVPERDAVIERRHCMSGLVDLDVPVESVLQAFALDDLLHGASLPRLLEVSSPGTADGSPWAVPWLSDARGKMLGCRSSASRSSLRRP